MERRRLLQLVLAGLSTPLWLREAWASAAEEVALLAAKAELETRPLLIVMVPAEKPWERFDFWEAVLLEGSDALMARFGQCNLVCATDEAAYHLFGLQNSPWFNLLIAGKEPIQASLPPLPEIPKPDPLLELKTISPILRTALATAPPSITPELKSEGEMVLEQYDAVLQEKDWTMMEYMLAFLRDYVIRLTDAWGESLPTELAKVREQFESRSFVRISDPDDLYIGMKIDQRLAAMSELLERVIGGALGPLPADSAALTERAIKLYRNAAMPNTRWGHAGGCGSSYLQPDGTWKSADPSMMCGMGHVAPRAAKFLRFYTA